MEIDYRNLRSLFSDVIRGYSNIRDSFFGNVYIKHLNNIDLAEIDSVYNHYYNEALKKRIPTYKEKCEYLLKTEQWNKKDEEKLVDYKKTLIDFEANVSNQFLKSKRDMWVAEIKKIKLEIESIESRKNALIGDICEGFASKKSNETHILSSYYKDPELKNKLFTQEEFNELEDEKILKTFEIFNKHSQNFNSEFLKKLSISPIFLNMFYLSGDNIYYFYGKPIIYLTFYQIELFSLANNFKTILSEFGNTIPKDIMADPDKLLEYVELNRNYKKAFPEDDEGGGGRGIMGATKSDLETLGIQAGGNDKLSEELKKKGGKLSMQDLMKMSNE